MTDGASGCGGTAWAFLDLDGTLTDAAPGITRSIDAALSQLGLPSPGVDALRGRVGPPLHETFSELGVPDAEVDEAIAFYRARYTTVGLFENGVFPGVPEMMAALKARGWRLALATSKPIVYAAKITMHFGLDAALDAQFGSELDGTRADKPSLLAHALSKTGADPGRSLMLGDRRHDAAGAHANGLRALGASWGYGSEDELKDAGAMPIAAPADVADQAGEAG
ncbi:MAG: HAD hydrolase-like protein [Pseudomonadota bacterium]